CATWSTATWRPTSTDGSGRPARAPTPARTTGSSTPLPRPSGSTRTAGTCATTCPSCGRCGARPPTSPGTCPTGYRPVISSRSSTTPPSARTRWPATRRSGPADPARRRHDPVLTDLAVDRGPGHSQVARRLGPVAADTVQARHDGVALDRLQRGEHAAADGLRLGGQVGQRDRPGPAVRHDPPDDLVELLDVARPPVAQQHPHRIGRAHQPAGTVGQAVDQERHEVAHVVHVVAQRRYLDRLRELLDDAGQRAVDPAGTGTG